jgi:pyruvate dehydrogenase kinase 2/3/4
MFEDYPTYQSPQGNGSGTTSTNGNGFNKVRLRVPMERRYFARPKGDDRMKVWPPEIQDYNMRFTKTLEKIKTRHDPTVTTVAQGVLEWKQSTKERMIGLDMQAWLDRFYLSRIGIRFLIGQRELSLLFLVVFWNSWAFSFSFGCMRVLCGYW